MPNIIIRPIKPDEINHLLNLWNQSIPADAINLDILERKILLDPNFTAEGLLIAENAGLLVGFMLCIIRRVPLENIGLQEKFGWITMTGILPEYRRQGIGTMLYQQAEQFFKKYNRKTISIATYAPNYFIPGIDVKEYAGAIQFFKKHGFISTAQPLSMDASIVTYKIPDNILEKEENLKKDGITIHHYRREMLLSYMQFLEKYMPGDWVRFGRDNLTLLTLGKFKEEQILLAFDGNNIIGFAQYEDEHFGPFGVRDDYQGKGIGTVLLARTIQFMHQRGYHNAWFLWSDDKSAKVYEKVGFNVTRRFLVMKKELN